MDFIVENSLAGKREGEKPIPEIIPEVKKEKVLLVEIQGQKRYITEEQLIIEQKKGKKVKIIRELNI